VVSFAKLSAFSLASFELQAQSGGTMRYADAVYDLEDQISLSPQAMGMVGSYTGGSVLTTRADEEESGVDFAG
jgi:hypothetical protein